MANGKASGLMPASFLPNFPEIAAKSAEAGAASAQILAKTIMGEMSMDDYDAAVKDWKQKFGPTLDTQNKWIGDNKDKLRSKGVKIFEQ